MSIYKVDEYEHMSNDPTDDQYWEFLIERISMRYDAVFYSFVYVGVGVAVWTEDFIKDRHNKLVRKFNSEL